MNCYLFFVFMTLCFGPCALAREVYYRPRTNSAEPTEETKKKLNGDAGSSVVSGLVRVASKGRTWTLWLRKLLKALRKWCNSHPPEVKLENPKETGYPSNKLKIRRDGCAGQKRIFGEIFIGKKIIFVLRDFLTDVVSGFRHYRDVIFKSDLVVCLWDYFWKKFWAWVDSAPDSRRFLTGD